MTWILYRREACPLCDHAVEALSGAGLTGYHAVNIGWQGELAQRYGTRIPVLCHEPSGACLDWPFDTWSIKRLVERVAGPPTQ